MKKGLIATAILVFLAVSPLTRVSGERVQLLVNGGFDQDLANWEAADVTIVQGFQGNGARLGKSGVLCQIAPAGSEYLVLGGEVLVNLAELHVGDGVEIRLSGAGEKTVYVNLRHFSMAIIVSWESAFGSSVADFSVPSSSVWYSLQFLQQPLNETISVALYHVNGTSLTEVATARVTSPQPTGLTRFRLSWITGSETARIPGINSAVTVDSLSYFMEGGVQVTQEAGASCLGPGVLFVTILAVVALWLAAGAAVVVAFFWRERRRRRVTATMAISGVR